MRSQCCPGHNALTSLLSSGKGDVPIGKTRNFGQYRLERTLGHGAMGAVYLAEHEETHEQVALKILPTTVGANSEYARRFVTEARLAAQIDHPGVVRVLDFGKAKGHYYLAMDYVEGETARARIRRQKKMDWREAAAIAIQVAEGLAEAARQGIIHRDIKPENILLDHGGRAMIADLGLAKEMGVQEHLPSDTSLGTPDYMSPEQVNNSEMVDLRSDIYSLGASLFHMVCGKAPYTGHSAYEVMVMHVAGELPSPKKYAPDLARDVCDVMRKMMARDAEDRYQDYEELLSDLNALLAGAPVAAEEFDEESLLSANGSSQNGLAHRHRPKLIWAAVVAAVGVLVYLLLASPF
jgi:serine/threonine-protein kinase